MIMVRIMIMIMNMIGIMIRIMIGIMIPAAKTLLPAHPGPGAAPRQIACTMK